VIVVLDTNACVYDTHLLGSSGGQQLVKLLETHRGELFLPEILRREYFSNATAATRRYEADMRADGGKIRLLLGQDVPVEPVSDEIVERSVHARLQTLAHILREGATVAALYHDTGERVIARRPPATANNDNYKDCMIWEALLRLPAGSEVWLISHDGAFYEGDDFHPTLSAEAIVRDISLHAHKSLTPLMRELRARTQQLDLAGAEAAEKAQNIPEVEPAALILPAPATLPTADPPGAPGCEVDEALERIRATFEPNDARVLGFIAFLGAPSRQQLLKLAEMFQMDPNLVQNSADRLAQATVVRDSGTHYRIPNAALAAAARDRVLEEIVRLFALGRRRGP
jgi:hypothetical protein